jgi:hypothetical protein
MSENARKDPGFVDGFFIPSASFNIRARVCRRKWTGDEVHLYIGPKGARFVPIFGKSGDFFKK